MGITTLALGGTSALMGATNAFYGAKNQQRGMRFEADMADINAQLSETTAQSALLQGQQEEGQVRLRTAALKGTQRKAIAANGVDVHEGTAAEILTSGDVMGEIDANTVAANAVRTAWGYRTQGTNFKNDAAMKRSAASSISPGMALGTSLLSSATQVATSWYGLNKVGALGGGGGIPALKLPNTPAFTGGFGALPGTAPTPTA